MNHPLARVSAALRSLPKEKQRALSAALLVTFVQVGLLWFLQARRESSSPGDLFISVVVAKRNLSAGEPFKSEDFETLAVPYSELAKHVLLTNQVANLTGVPLRNAVQAGNPINVFSLIDVNEKQIDPAKVPQGKRLHVVEVQLGRLASIVRAGDRVDVLANIPVPDVGTITEVLLEGAEVVAAAGMETGGNALSFHLTPDEVKAMVHASQFARFTVSLRNPTDLSNRNGSPAMTLARLLEDPRLRKSLNGSLWSLPTETNHKASSEPHVSGRTSLPGNAP